jgi:hypothetical protein
MSKRVLFGAKLVIMTIEQNVAEGEHYINIDFD